MNGQQKKKFLSPNTVAMNAILKYGWAGRMPKMQGAKIFNGEFRPMPGTDFLMDTKLTPPNTPNNHRVGRWRFLRLPVPKVDRETQ